MKIGQAVEHLRDGDKVARAGWNGTGMYLFLVAGSTFKVNRPPLLDIYPEDTEIDYSPHIDICTKHGSICVWTASQTDLLATDWELTDPCQDSR